MKPIKNKVFCQNCGRTKMLFETEKKAENFIKFNREEIEAESGYGTQRSYFCLFCGGWHTTSLKEKIGLSKKEQMLEKFKKEKEKNILCKNDIVFKKNSAVENQEEQNKKIRYLESQIEGMGQTQKVNFISEKISNLNKEIDLLLNSNINTSREKLKEHRQNLAILYMVRKKNGITKNNKKFEEAKEKEFEEWRLWAEKRGY